MRDEITAKVRKQDEWESDEAKHPNKGNFTSTCPG